jgi:hypothetical protein
MTLPPPSLNEMVNDGNQKRKREKIEKLQFSELRVLIASGTNALEQ